VEPGEIVFEYGEADIDPERTDVRLVVPVDSYRQWMQNVPGRRSSARDYFEAARGATKFRGQAPTYSDALAERYPWADATDIQRGAVFLQANLRDLVDGQLMRGTREVDWDRVEAIGSKLGSIIGRVPDVTVPVD